MILVAMLKEGRDELICDFAETYHIYDIMAYPVSLIATLAAGLGEKSRIRMKMGGQSITTEESLLSLIFDKLNWLCWTKTKEAEHRRNMPESLYAILTGTSKKKEAVRSFATPEEFEKRRRELLGENNG